jgi:1-deoxy-D-xylulose-5-phosphate synthase
MASEGLKPVFAVYSTFLQRAYDQVLHDVCIQRLPVIFAIDRAGIVGEDGETHQGVFDLSFLSHMPNMTILTPKCVNELKFMFRWAIKQNYPVAIRYPRGGDNNKVQLEPLHNFTRGKWEIVQNMAPGRISPVSGSTNTSKIAIIAAGKMVQQALLSKEKLSTVSADITVVNACFIKPIDKELIEELVSKGYSLITLEDNVIQGGLGSAVLQYVSQLNNTTKVLNLGFKDEFITHGGMDILYKLYGLDVNGITKSIMKLL